MATKTISVNPEFFNNSKNKKTKKKLKHSLRTNFNKLQKNFLKKKMINKIKNFKKKNKIRNNQETPIGMNDEYTEAIDFMEDVVKKRKTKKNKKQRKQQTMQQGTQQTMQQGTQQTIQQGTQQTMQLLDRQPVDRQQNMQIIEHKNFNKFNQEIKPQNVINIKTEVSNDLINIKNNLIKPDPPYGILKKGKKQLYSKYRKSLSNNSLAFTDSSNFGKEMDISQEIKNIKKNFLLEDIPIRKNNLEKLKNKFMENNNLTDNSSKKGKFKIKNKKIIRKFLLGKNNKTRKIGILIKNKKTKKLINKDFPKLERKNISNIKKFLVDKALIKVGTSAPENVLREMYINCHLSGELQNSGGKYAEDILMHNWNN